MAHAVNFFGRPYDDTVPAFVNVDTKFVYDRIRRRLLDKASLVKAMADAKPAYTAGAKEMADAKDWLLMHLGFGVPTAAVATTTTPATTDTTTTPATGGA